MFYSIVTEAFEICIEFWDDEIKKKKNNKTIRDQ